MRIVLVAPSFPKLSETFIVNKFLGLLERGWDAHLVCNSSDPAEWRRLPQSQRREDLCQRVHTGWPHRPRWLAALLMPLAVLSALAHNPCGTLRYLRNGWKRWGVGTLRKLYLDVPFLNVRPELVHFEFGPLARGRIHLKEILGCRVVTSFRGYDLNFAGLDDPRYYAEVWEHSDGLHFLGEDLWRRARNRGCPASKLHALIAPAIDTEFFDPGERAQGELLGTVARPLRILSVGRLEWKKGYEFALQAIRLLRDRGLHCDYQIVGDGAFFEAVAFGRHQLDIEGQVELLGAMPPSQVKEKMRQADVFLHAAVSEGFCNAVLEAQAMRLPVVCSDADGLAENVAEGESGFVVARRNPRALAEKLDLLARNPELREKMGQAGRERVMAHFQVSDQISAWERLYRQVTSQIDRVPEPVETLAANTRFPSRSP